MLGFLPSFLAFFFLVEKKGVGTCSTMDMEKEKLLSANWLAS
jgi:hypothetical protein